MDRAARIILEMGLMKYHPDKEKQSVVINKLIHRFWLHRHLPMKAVLKPVPKAVGLSPLKLENTVSCTKKVLNATFSPTFVLNSTHPSSSLYVAWEEHHCGFQKRSFV